MCLRPATPGFLITLAATVCLVIVSFSVPYFKTVYFLEASLAVDNIVGNVTFGTLGYCLQLPGNTTCSSPKVGYQFSATELNELLGLDGAIQIPDLFVSWLTYPLVLHIVGLILAAIAAIFGLLAHVREMAMTCFSTFVSGFAATIVLLAFIFDLVIFFVARSRLNSVAGGSAAIGAAVWLTLAAWLLLFFAGCAFGFGRCCIGRRPRGGQKFVPQPDNSYTDAIRLDAIKAEADRKARQQTEVGLPAFQEYEARPLTSSKEVPKYLEEEEEEEDAGAVPYRDHSPQPLEKRSPPPPLNAVPGSYYSSPSRSEYQRPPVEQESPFGANATAPSAPTYDASRLGYPNAAYGQPAYAAPPIPTYTASSQPATWQSGNPYDTGAFGRETATEYEGGSSNIYSPSAASPYEAPAMHDTRLGSSNVRSDEDYVDPYSRQIETSQQEPAYSSPAYQAHAGYAFGTGGTMLDTNGGGGGTEYRSPYLPRPEAEYNASAGMGAGYVSPTSPAGPRGPRPPSSGYYR